MSIFVDRSSSCATYVKNQGVLCVLGAGPGASRKPVGLAEGRAARAGALPVQRSANRRFAMASTAAAR